MSEEIILDEKHDFQPLRCECTNTETQRIKDIILDTNDGERTKTIYILYCMDCGDIVTIDW